MNENSLSSRARVVVAIARSSVVFRWILEQNPDVLQVLIQAADAAKTPYQHARLLAVLSEAAEASDKCVEAMCRPAHTVDLTELSLINGRANEELGRILKELVPSLVTIGIPTNRSAAPS